MKIFSSLKEQINYWSNIFSEINNLKELYFLAKDENDTVTLSDIESDILRLDSKIEDSKHELLFSGKYDKNNVILAIHAGAGGVDSQDWTEMLMRMYLRWSERSNFNQEVLDISSGDESGIKSVVIQISGIYAYGYLQSEKGVHRLVRLSPFDSDHARHTSFALVEVLPESEKDFNVEINQNELKIDVFKAGGAGGQSVQKNSTAVRITHLPTGIKVTCQNERSLVQNKEIAMKILYARLEDRAMQIQEKEKKSLKGEHISAEWGNQIRSYVLHPYKMVKDHRTNLEVSDPDNVLDGDILQFMKSYLNYKLGD